MIREANAKDFESIWLFFEPIIKAEATYAFDANMSYDDAFHLWMESPEKTYVYIESNTVLGSYYIKPNAYGPGKHVSNCGYMVSEKARGKGIATKMCQHSQDTARALGFKAMQFNSVVSENTGAIQLWKKLGFEIVGTLPNAYLYQGKQFIDTHVMYKWLMN